MASNYDDVLGQLTAAGLRVDYLNIGRLTRCKVEGDREKRGWYHLHEMRLDNGDELIVGSYGVWQGTSSNATKVELRKAELSAEQRDAMRKRLAEDRKRAELARQAEAEKAAERARKAWAACSEAGHIDYLDRKGVGAHGVRFSPQGAMVVPMLDATGRIHGLQIIRGSQAAKGRKLNKEFWPAGLAVKGHFHQIGLPQPHGVLLLTEGYATGASLYEATGMPVAIAFSANNLAPVAEALAKRYKGLRVLVCADDDKFSAGNPGITAASTAALAVGGEWVAPVFADEAARQAAFDGNGTKISDFNDLHAAEGLHVVRNQVAARLTALNWHAAPKRVTTAAGGEGGAAHPASNTPAPLRPVDSLDELLERFSLVYGQGGTVFDHHQHRLVALSDMRDLCLAREIHRDWMEHPDRHIVAVENVGFDPACTDPEIQCNLWAGWPTTPKAGNCEHLLDLLRYMCSNDDNPERLYQWAIRWLAYPIQHPGAKMKTTIVVHGPQGTGKNQFFEAYMAIFGRYGRVIDQSAIEDKFNDWASRKLFLIADEVVARSDLYHIKNKLKAFITGDWIRINPKGMSAYDERNHVNMVFLSNEAQPVVLEEDDRRHAVIYTPEKLSPDFYAGVRAEIANGGIEALHHYLAHLDLGDFDAGTLPPATRAKQTLVALSMDSPQRFVHAMRAGDVEGFPAEGKPALLLPARSQDVFDLYVEWCRRQGIRALSQPKFVNVLEIKFKATTARKRLGGTGNPVRVLTMPGGHTMPDGEYEGDWLQMRCDTFTAALRDFKNHLGSYAQAA